MIIQASQGHASQIIEISDSCFGSGYITTKQVWEHINNNTAWVYLYNGSIAAFVLIINDNSTESTIKTLAVDTKFQNRGIGKELLEYTCNKLLKNSSIHYYAWKENLLSQFTKTLLGLGFIKTKTIENYWKEDSIANGYQCIKCGNPCLCTLQIYKLTGNIA